MTNDRERPKIPTVEIGYIDEHLTAIEKYIARMREAFDAGDAMNFVDNFGAMQNHERSIIVACAKIMTKGKFDENDLSMKPIDSYR